MAISLLSRMPLKHVFAHNLKKFRKKEKLSQMKLAEYCNASTGYISEIEIGRKFPSADMIEKIAKALSIEPYHLFKDWAKEAGDLDVENTYPFLPAFIKNEIKSQIEVSINEIFDKY